MEAAMKRALSLLLFFCLLFSFAIAENVTQWDYEMTIGEYTISGQYTGEIKDGKPDGFGIYETSTPNGTACHYIGEWKDGIMQGSGAMYWNDGSLEIGEYDKGVFITGKYNYNGLKLLTAKADGEATLNPYWLNKITRAAAVEEEAPVVMYIGNRNSHVFHTLDCDSVRTMKEKNKIEFYSRDEAIEKKYKPCSRCSP